MSTHAVTQTSQWDGTPPQVPDGTSSSGASNNTMGNATQVIEALTTKLSNRTLHTHDAVTALQGTVGALDSAAAKKAGGNAFTGNQSIAGSVSVTGSGNTLTTAGAVTVGSDLSVGNKLTVDDNVTLNGNAVTIPNASITQTSGSLHLTNGSIDAGGSIETKGGDLLLPGTKRVKYTGSTSDRTRLKRVRMAAGTIRSNQPDAAYFSGGRWTTFNTAYILSVPLPNLATGTVVTLVWLRYEASDAEGVVELIRHTIGDWGVSPGGATPSVTVLGSAALTATGSGVKTALFTVAETLSSTQSDYWIRVTGDAGSTHDIHGALLTVQLTSPGVD